MQQPQLFPCVSAALRNVPSFFIVLRAQLHIACVKEWERWAWMWCNVSLMGGGTVLTLWWGGRRSPPLFQWGRWWERARCSPSGWQTGSWTGNDELRRGKQNQKKRWGQISHLTQSVVCVFVSLTKSEHMESKTASKRRPTYHFFFFFHLIDANRATLNL